MTGRHSTATGSPPPIRTGPAPQPVISFSHGVFTRSRAGLIAGCSVRAASRSASIQGGCLYLLSAEIEETSRLKGGERSVCLQELTGGFTASLHLILSCLIRSIENVLDYCALNRCCSRRLLVVMEGGCCLLITSRMAPSVTSVHHSWCGGSQEGC